MVLWLHIPHEKADMSLCHLNMHHDWFFELDNQVRTPKWMAEANAINNTAYTAIARKQTIRNTPEVKPRSERRKEKPQSEQPEETSRS